ncbi:glycerol-3-phosphate dehydrogenase [Leifsonia xyli subsp. cynodontis DSM 46306]|uniref:FAD-dependent oxidoreductase n=1 Tax=Leifsonia xyli subsp. cynodontis DSM 46306 TaxID=1389489 RepID=U3P4F7_LEIXC|nr:glycerol-3-phosphate dehydrogenase/oxidase [Leifsonia xyli]AGW40646.1 glycerol-3-phosphate dehydrogenase [Leifsonia xyli subsp. cynodontis DSM 46306]
MTTKSTRRPEVQRIAERPTAQVLIVGGGINGLGTFRDLALQGVDVVLVERNDFVSGASAASSHMIHGGIRYLENGEFRLVKESITERNGLLRIAPHYVKPLETTIPIFSTFSGIMAAPLRFLTHKSGKPKERGAFLIKTGLTIYDAFSRDGGSVPRHRFHGRKKSLEVLPALNPGLKYTATYFDASVHDPERLALDVLADGLAAGPHARAANYAEAVGAKDGGVLVRDRETGEEFSITADIVINASGPWTDLTNDALGQATRYMGGTKGSHIVLDNPQLMAACQGREMFFENDDGRIVLIYPLKGRVMVGTTDIEADIATPAVCTEDEIDYFIELVAHVFPGIPVTREQIVYTFSGVRPLPHHDDTAPGFVSRDYRIVPGAVSGLGATMVLSLVGGKWTTFRALSEHLANEALEALGLTRTVSTLGLPIGGGAGFPATPQAERDWIARYGADIGAERAATLLHRYGTRACAIIAAIAAWEGDDVALAGAPGYSRAEIDHLIRTEHVAHLSDVFLRRTSLAFTGAVSVPLVREIAEIAANVLGWSPKRRTEEEDTFQAELAGAHLVHLTSGDGSEAAALR